MSSVLNSLQDVLNDPGCKATIRLCVARKKSVEERVKELYAFRKHRLELPQADYVLNWIHLMC